MISTPVFMRTMIDHPRFDAHRHVVGAALLARRRGRRARDGARGRARVRLLVQAHVRIHRVPDAHDRPARRRSRARRDHRRPPHRRGPSCASSTPTTLADVAPGAPGELLARGPEMFVGYLDRRARRGRVRRAAGGSAPATSPASTATHLTIVDRLKDVIIRGGENISAQEVEALLVTHPAVAEAACVAAPDPVMGEEVCAFVIPAAGAAPTLEACARTRSRRAWRASSCPSRLELRTELAAHRERQGAEGAAARRVRRPAPGR